MILYYFIGFCKSDYVRQLCVSPFQVLYEWKWNVPILLVKGNGFYQCGHVHFSAVEETMQFQPDFNPIWISA